MIRYSFLLLAVSGIMLYAWKDWFRALCLLVVMMAIMERPDMPKTMLGVSGLNPFNITLAMIAMACFVAMLREERPLPFGWGVGLLLFLYVGVMFIAYTRMIQDREHYYLLGVLRNIRVTPMQLTIDNLVNTMKWMIPGLLMMLGARDKTRVKFALYCIFILYGLLAFQILRQMPPSYVLDVEALEMRALRVLERRVGYHRVDLAMILAGAAWAPLAARGLFTSRFARLGITGLSGLLVAALIMTGGRTGWIAWAATGLVLSLLRWRHYLVIAPLAAALGLGFMPGVQERLLQGIDTNYAISSSGGIDTSAVDTDTVTSGRTKVWPRVIQEIKKEPLFGFGRLAHLRTGVFVDVYKDTGEVFGHPHSAYLQFALDNGIIGLAIAVLFHLLLIWKAMRLFVDRQDPLASAVGGLALGLVLAFMLASFGAQTFYPIQGTVGMWCAMGLCVRMTYLRKQERAAGAALPAPAPGAPAAPAATLPSGVAVGAPARVVEQPRNVSAGPSMALWSHSQKPRHNRTPR
jgi:O-antigen ligase